MGIFRDEAIGSSTALGIFWNRFRNYVNKYAHERLNKQYGELSITYTSEFTTYSTGDQKFRVFKRGNRVYITGAVKPTATIAASADADTVTTLPTGYRPPYNIHKICQGSSWAHFLCVVNTNGQITISRYAATNTYKDMTTSMWLHLGTISYDVEG